MSESTRPATESPVARDATAAPATTRAAPVGRSQAILALQRTHGNAAVERLLAGAQGARLLRAPPTDAPPAPAPAAPQAPGAPGVAPATDGASPAPVGAPPTGGGPANQLVKPPPAKGEAVVHVPSQVLLSESREYVRFNLENYFAHKGADLIDRFDTADNQFKLGYTGSQLDPTTSEPVPGSPQAAYRERVVTLTRDELSNIRVARSIFLEHFERRANGTLNTLLDKSKEQIEKDKERYGAQVSGWIFKDYSLKSGEATDDLASFAKKLQAKHQAFHQTAASLEPPPRAELPEGGGPQTDEAAAAYKKRQEAIAAAQAKLEPIEAEYAALRREAEGKHPILVAYALDLQGPNTANALAGLSTDSGETRAAMIVKEITTKLENIETVRSQASKDPWRIWKLDRVVGPTKNLPDVQTRVPLSVGMRDELVRDKVLTVTLDDEFRTMATTVVTAALTLVAMAATGGAAGLALTAAGGAATATGAAVDLVLLAQAAKDYQFESAAAGSNYDKAQAISQDEPDLFWLAVQIVMTSVGASAAAKELRATIGQIGRFRSEALALKAASMQGEAKLAGGLKPKYDAALAKLEAEGERAAPGKGAGKKLRDEVEATDPSRVRRTTGPGVPPGAPGPPPIPNAIMQGPNGEPISRMDAFSQYHREIEANPGREYAVLQRGRSEEFAVVIGEQSSVQIPRDLPEDWGFVTHYHPNFEWIDAKRMRLVESNFVARIPSPEDMNGAMARSTMQGKVSVMERLDWADPTRNRTTIYQTTFGYTPLPDKPGFGTFWVEHASEMGGMAPRREFKSLADYQTWFGSLQPAGPPTIRTPTPH